MGDDFDPLVWKRATELLEASLRRDPARAHPAPSVALIAPEARARLLAKARDELARERRHGGGPQGVGERLPLARLYRRLRAFQRAARRKRSCRRWF